ncbi:protocadherin gamma-B1-like isoform X37 [Pseudophryne corroboree]|uniref:protocadherin gamma-B1-like isoform X37 n=1 Tax=Pseudophryne corroboree TaxID=495146 RepID=UPI003081AFF5
MKTHEAMAYKGWQVAFYFFISGFCHSGSAQIHYTIVEEMRKGSFVGNLAKDLGFHIKELSDRHFRLVSHVSEKYFSVQLDNGNLYIKDRIDRETLCPATDPCFLTFDVLVENPLHVFNVKVEIQDTNDNVPKFYFETIKLDIVESTLPGARFVLQTARDPDLSTNSIKSYMLSDNQYFTLGEKTNSDGIKHPEIILEKPLDRETQSCYELILTASDGGSPMLTGTTQVKISVTDVNDNFPIFTQEMYKVILNENMPLHTLVVLVKAIDNDEGSNAEITYSFSDIPEDALKVFEIGSKSGEIKTKGTVDFEKMKTYEISVQAQDGGGLVSHASVVVQILDMNDNAPEITLNSLSSPISEDSLPGTVVALINIHDKDSEENSEVVCEIKDALPFKLLSSSGHYYKIVTTTAMDREEISYYNIVIVATDKGSPPLSTIKNISLIIADVNDNPPVFQKSNYVAYITENNLPGGSMYSMQATDPDTEENGKITYSIVSSHVEKFPVFSFLSINPVTGVLYAQRSFDYEDQKEFQIQIIAKDNGLPSLSTNTTLKIIVIDRNDNAPKILYPSPESDGMFEIVPLASEQGYLVTKVVAVDADSGHNGWLSYHFMQTSEPSYFTIGHNTGEIRTSHTFQEKDNFRQKLIVLVKDNGDPSLSATVTLNLVAAEDFQHVAPDLKSQSTNVQSQSNVQFYLVIALALICFFFMLTVILAVLSKCRKDEPSTSFSSINPNIYSQMDPQLFSRYSTASLPFPLSYDVCVALDSNESDFSFLKPNPSVPIDSLLDMDNSGISKENVEEPTTTNNPTEQAQPNTDWRFSQAQAQRPGPSGAQQPTEEAGVWPNNQFETERLQAMILASANEAAEGGAAIGAGTGTMGLSARYGPQFTLQHVPDYRQNIYIPGTTSTLTNAAGKRDGKGPSGNKKKSGKKEKK